MARLEGFEPPTLRSEVRSIPQSDKLAKGKSSVNRTLPFSFVISLRVVSCQCGNKNGNRPHISFDLIRSPNHDSQLQQDSNCRRLFRSEKPRRVWTKEPFTLRSIICVHCNSFLFSGVLPYSVSAMFPYCAAESIERDVISSRRSLGGEPLSA
jgi:hypothetical protein